MSDRDCQPPPGQAEEYDTGADGTVEATRVVTSEYDKSGNLIRSVHASNINDLGSGGDGSVYERVTTTTSYDKKAHPVLVVSELDADSNGTLESRSRTAYVYDARGNVVQTVSEQDQGARAGEERKRSRRQRHGRLYQRRDDGLRRRERVKGGETSLVPCSVRTSAANRWPRRPARPGWLLRQQKYGISGLEDMLLLSGVGHVSM